MLHNGRLHHAARLLRRHQKPHHAHEYALFREVCDAVTETLLVSKIPSFSNRKNVLGVDPSLNSTGLCVLVDDKLKMCYRVQTGLFGIERIIAIKNKIAEVIATHSIDVVGMEGYIYGRGMLVNNSFELHELGGVLKQEFHERGITPLIFSPMTIKKFVTGNARKVKKEDMIAGIKNHWNLNFSKKQNDIADAYAIAKFAYYLNAAQEMRIDPNDLYAGAFDKYQIEAIKGAYDRLK